MKIWIGALLFSLLIATKQQSQSSDEKADEELTDESYKLFISSTPNFPSPSPPYASIPSSIIPDEYPSDPEEVVHSGTIPAVSEIVEEIQHASDVESESPKDDKPAVKPSPPLIPSEEISAPPTNPTTDENLPPIEIETTTSVPPTSKPNQAELDPDVSPAETLEKISLTLEQEQSSADGALNQESEDGKSLPPETTYDGEDRPLPERIPATSEGEILVEENKTEQDSIPSFSEWTKLQIQLAQRKDTIINNIKEIKDKTSLQEGKNFASMDCGAKIVASNPEAQNPSGAISSSHDEYMLNRCTVSSWLVVELCEPLRIEKVALGNLELFSSSPNEFELGVSDRYPSRDWTTIGPFFAPAFRNLHSFQLPTNNSTFGKFLKVMIKSHHGKEHYCPLSLIKVFGRSEYEVLESETTHAEDVEQSNSNSNLALEEESNGPDEPSKQSVLGVAKDAVIEMVKKAASALVFKNISNADTELSSAESAAATANLSCISLAQCIPEGVHKDEIYRFLSCHGDILWNLHSIRSWCGWEFCHENLRTRSIGSPWMPEGLLVAIYGSSIIDSICNYMKPMNNCETRREEQHVVELTSGVPNDTQSDDRGTQSEPPTAVNSNNDLQNNEQQQQQAQFITIPTPESTPPPPQVLPPLLPEEPAQKESVFVRLSNRIKNLERNQSLSSGYLEELSRRFKKQSEELSATHEQFRKTLNESLSKCRNVEETLRFHINRLSRNNDNLRELIAKVEIQRGGVAFFAVLQFFCTLYFLWKTHGPRQQERKLPSPSAANTTTTAKVTNSHRTHAHRTGVDGSLFVQRKRSNSEQLKKVKKKKKKGLNGITPLAITPGSLTPNGDLNFVFTSTSRSSSVPPLDPSSRSSACVASTSGSDSALLTMSSVPRTSTASATGADESQQASKKKSKLLSLFSGSRS